MIIGFLAPWEPNLKLNIKEEELMNTVDSAFRQNPC